MKNIYPYKKQDSLLQKLHQARQDFDGPQG